MPAAIVKAFPLVSPASGPAAEAPTDKKPDWPALVVAAAPADAAAAAAIEAINAACTRCFASTGASPPVPNARKASIDFILRLVACEAASRLARILLGPIAAANTLC